MAQTPFLTVCISPPGGTKQIFIRGGSALRSNSLPFYIPFFTKKLFLLYTVELMSCVWPVNTLYYFLLLFLVCYVTDDVFPCPVSSGPHRTKARIHRQKIGPSEIIFGGVDVQISDESEKRMLFWCLLRKMAPIYPGTDELWQAENYTKLISPLGSITSRGSGK